VAGVLAVLTLVAYAGNRALEVAETGPDASARRAARLQPWSAQPWRVLGEAQLAAGEADRARETFLDALDRDDGDWELWLDLALASEGAERDRALARAKELNPLEPAIDELRAGS
jgi:tetratricopeptide (TPR) repeat protein